MPGSFVVAMPGHDPFEVVLPEGVTAVGRAESNALSLRDMNVSRHHFEVEWRAPLGYVLRDKASRNGTIVNGVSVMEKVLGEGDRVQVGGSVLTFRGRASAEARALGDVDAAIAARRQHRTPPPARPESGRPGSDVRAVGERIERAIGDPAQTPSKAFKLPGVGVVRSDTPTFRRDGRTSRQSDVGTIEGQRAGGPAGPAPPTAPEGSAERDRWQKLAEVACAINAEHDLDPLLEKILDAVMSLVPAQSGFLVLREGEALSIRCRRNAPAADLDDERGDYRLSRQVCQEAIAQKRPVLTQDAVGDDHLGQFMSVVNLRLKSILCVPFASQDEVLGVVYLDEPKVDLFAGEGEVVELVGAFGELAGIALANARLLQEIASRERLEEEMRIAAHIQSGFLPSRPPAAEGLEIAGRNRPARSVGGDLYDFFRREAPRREVLISIGDVAGKGVGAGLVMGTVRSLLRALAEVHEGTDEVLVGMNRHLSRDLESGMFVSFLLLRYEEETGQLAFTGAGHEHLVLYRPSTGQLEFMRAGGVVLGLVDEISGRISERRMTLQEGDVVCLYTDGATEARSPDNEEFGLERLGQAVTDGSTAPADVVERVVRAVVEFTGGEGREMHDDLTVVALRKA